jgi:enterochelin esterase-like enzyme
MEVRLYLPACYDTLPQARFPVLYLIHGMNYTEEQWENLGAVEVTDRLIRDRQAAPLIIVMPRDRLWKEPSETPFDEVFINELVPWVDANYRTLADRQHRAVGGLSRGGMWALHFGIGSWELFGTIGLHSSPVFWEDARVLAELLGAIPKDQLPRLFLDIGEKDYLIRSNQWLVKTLDQKNIPHEYYLYPGYHEEAYWAAHVEEYLRWYASGW